MYRCLFYAERERKKGTYHRRIPAFSAISIFVIQWFIVNTKYSHPSCPTSTADIFLRVSNFEQKKKKKGGGNPCSARCVCWRRIFAVIMFYIHLRRTKKIISYFKFRNYCLTWPPFFSYLGALSLWKVNQPHEVTLSVNFNAVLLAEHAFYARRLSLPNRRLTCVSAMSYTV